MSGLTGVLKHINKYLLQAKQIDKVDPVLGYYVRLYAVSCGMKLKSTKADAMVISELMSWCEKYSSLTSGLSRDDALGRMEMFALNIFDNADTKDRAGNADKSTAAQFMCAFVLMDVCHQWGELNREIETKMKYAMWKAADISKAIKAGIKPKPGGVNDEEYEIGLGINSTPQINYSHLDFSSNKAPLANGLPQPSSNIPDSQSNFALKSEPSAPTFSNPSYSEPSAPTIPFHDTDSIQNPSSIPPNCAMPINSGVNLTSPPHSMPTSLPSEFGAFGFSTESIAKSVNPTPTISPQNAAVPNGFSSIKPSIAIPLRSSTGTKSEAMREADRLLKHAASALHFDDIRTTLQKLEEAKAKLLPFSN